MKVCIVTTAFPRWPQDDRGVFVLEAARALAAQGMQVRVIAMHSPGAATREALGSVEVIRPRYLWPERWEVLQREGGGLPIVWRTSRLARLAILPFTLVQTAAVMRYARGYDIIHANWTLSAAVVWASRFIHRRPFLVTVQGSDIFQATRIPLVSPLTRIVLTAAGRVVALSRSLAEATIALGVPPELVEIIPNGVDTDYFSPPTAEREPLVLFVGSLIERKGVAYLIQAMPHFLARFPDYRLVIVGEGPQREHLGSMAQSLGIAPRVTFVGPQAPAQVRMWMQRARLFVLPSLEEGLGVVLLEALACGTPCVGSSVGGIQDVLSPEVGIRVPPADPFALADAMAAILSNSSLWEGMSRQARQRAVEHYSWPVIASRLIQLYTSILARGDSTTPPDGAGQ